MPSELNQKIEQAQQGMFRLKKIDNMLKQLESEQQNLKQKANELKVILEKENYDIEKLENHSIASVFYSILGNLDQHLSQERQEALTAKLRYEQVLKDLEDIRTQIANLSTERLNFADCQKDYQLLFAQKRDELMQENGATAQEILALTDKLNRTKINLKEIAEAIIAGNAVLDSLNTVLDSLDSAGGWGTLDLLGGGLITDLVKHSHIDNAKFETENTQRLLRKFKSELTDINITSDIIIETDGFAKFADFFFDGLIADWYMKSKITESQESVKRVTSQVLSVINKLEDMKTKEKNSSELIKTKINELIVNA